MASIDGRQLDINESTYGMVGLLPAPAPISARMDFSDDQVSFEAGSRAVVAVTSGVPGPEELLISGYRLLQAAVDLAACHHHVHLEYDDLIHQHLLWWPAPGLGRILRWADCVETNVHTSVSWTVRRADGTEEHSELPGLPSWVEAFRYFRKSQTASSAGDAYRYMYLAMEQIMSFAHPHAGEGEGAWTRAALATLVGRGVQLGVYATSHPDPIKAFMGTFYAARNGHSHAKAGKGHLVPQDLEYHEEVLDTLVDLGQLVIHAFGVLGWDETTGGGMVLGGIELLNNAMDPTLFATEDDSPAAESDIAISPRGLPAHALDTTYLSKVDPRGFDYGWLGRIAVSELSSSRVGRVAACFRDVQTDSFTPWCVENPPLLDVADVEIFERKLVHVHGRVFGRIRRHYPH